MQQGQQVSAAAVLALQVFQSAAEELVQRLLLPVLPELPQEQEFQQILSSGQKKRPQLFHMILHLLNLRFLCKYACSFPP